MSKKHHKPGADHPSADPKEDGGEEKSTKRHVYVEPGVQIDFVEDLRKQQKTNRSEDTTQHNKQLFWTKVAAGLILLYTLFSGWQVKIAKDTFTATNRPYVGVNTIAVSYGSYDSTGRAKFEQTPTRESEIAAMSARAEIKNFGPVPGVNFHVLVKVFIDGKLVPESVLEPGIGSAQLTCPNTDTDRSDQSVPVFSLRCSPRA